MNINLNDLSDDEIENKIGEINQNIGDLQDEYIFLKGEIEKIDRIKTDRETQELLKKQDQEKVGLLKDFEKFRRESKYPYDLDCLIAVFLNERETKYKSNQKELERFSEIKFICRTWLNDIKDPAFIVPLYEGIAIQKDEWEDTYYCYVICKHEISFEIRLEVAGLTMLFGVLRAESRILSDWPEKCLAVVTKPDIYIGEKKIPVTRK
jgi:hypothetical protein